MALRPIQERAVCARWPGTTISARSVPWQPPSISAELGSISTAKSRGQEFRAVAAQPQQPVALGRDLFAVVEDVGDVPAGRGQRGQPELHRDPGFHIRGPAAVQARALDAGPQVARDRHGVDVPGQDHPLRPPERGPGHDRVAVAVHGQVRQRPERGLDGVGERALIAADRRGVHKPGGQCRPVELKIHPASLLRPSADGLAPPRAARSRSPRPRDGARSRCGPPRTRPWPGRGRAAGP